MGKGITGLANLGNTCFMNACLQVLSHTYELSHLPLQINTSKPESQLLTEWLELRNMLWGEKGDFVAPKKFLKTVQTIAVFKKQELFAGFAQNDVSEFFLFLMDCFHTALAREIGVTISGTPSNPTDILAIKCFEMMKETVSKDYSEIWNLFYAVQVSMITRVDNGKLLIIKPEPYLMIDLPIPPDNRNPSLIDCLRHYVQGELIEKYVDEQCNETVSIYKKIQFWSFPMILTIDLKRFNARFQKNQIHVTFPLTSLDLSEFVVGYNKSQYKYDLYGVCNHRGGTMGGHYTSYVKNEHGKWFHFNDTQTTEVESEESIVSPMAYVLFYRMQKK